MPTKRKRIYQNADNLPATMVEEEVCPALHTAAGLKLQRPDAYAGVVQGLVEGTALTTLRKKYKVSPNTVAVIRAREKEVIAACKPVLRGLIGYAAQSALETFICRLEGGKIPDGVLPIAVGILVDKHRQAEGEPTQVIEVKRTATLDQVKKELDSLKQAEVIDISEDKREIRERMVPNPCPVEGDEGKPVKELYLEDSPADPPSR